MVIIFRTIIEVLGKPPEHVEASLKSYVEKLKDDHQFKIEKIELASLEKQEKEGLWSCFAELEVKTDTLQNMIYFCFEYMPAVIEVLEPEQFTLKDVDISNFLTDLQARLHNVDMVAKQVKVESNIFKRNLGNLLKNYIQVLLTKENLTSLQLSRLTGVDQEQLEDFLDQLIDERKIDLKQGLYYLRPKEGLKTVIKDGE